MLYTEEQLKSVNAHDFIIETHGARQLSTCPIWFSMMMERKLKDNIHKGDWRDNCSPQYLFSLLLNEISELHNSLIQENIDPINICLEAADVGNLAMMIADVIYINKTGATNE